MQPRAAPALQLPSCVTPSRSLILLKALFHHLQNGDGNSTMAGMGSGLGTAPGAGETINNSKSSLGSEMEPQDLKFSEETVLAAGPWECSPADGTCSRGELSPRSLAPDPGS